MIDEEISKLIYGVIVGTESEPSKYMNLPYEGVLAIMIDRLLSNEQLPLTIWRRCCSSVHEQRMSVETCNKIRELAGVAGVAGVAGELGDEGKDDLAHIKKKLENGINNWYLRGKISISNEDLTLFYDECDGACQTQ